MGEEDLAKTVCIKLYEASSYIESSREGRNPQLDKACLGVAAVHIPPLAAEGGKYSHQQPWARPAPHTASALFLLQSSLSSDAIPSVLPPKHRGGIITACAP